MRVPEGWKIKNLGDVCNFTQGVQIAERNTIKKYLEGYRRYIYIRDLFSDRHIVYVKDKYPDKVLNTSDIVMVNTGNTSGSVYRGKPGILCNNAFRISVKNEELRNIDQEFLWFYLNSDARDLMLKRLFNPAGQPHVGHKNVARLIIKIPPLKEQQKIAQILSTWDQAITTTEELLANSQQQKKALMQQLLTGKKRLLDDEGKRFRGEWKTYQLNSIAKIVMGSSPKSSAYNENEIGLPLIQGNADIEERKTSPRVFTSEITQECQVGDIILSVRAPVGSIAKSMHHACIGRGVAAIETKQDFSQNFLYQWLLWFEPRWQTFAQGSTFESINSSDIKNLKLLIPEKEEQEKIASVLTTADAEITALEQKIEQLKQEKKALMQQLLTGKKRVKVKEAN